MLLLKVSVLFEVMPLFEVSQLVKALLFILFTISLFTAISEIVDKSLGRVTKGLFIIILLNLCCRQV